MKIVHIITRMILGGAMENTLLTCEGLKARGHEVILITGPALGPEGELMTRALAGGYQVEVLDDLRREIAPRHDLRAYRRLVALLAHYRPDVVHTHSSKAGILGRQAAWKVRQSVQGCERMLIVHTIHGLPFHRFGTAAANFLYVHLERHAARQSDALISVADAMTRQAMAAGVGEPGQYRTIYSGMDVGLYSRRPEGVTEFRSSLGLKDGDVLVTQVSRLAELKGHEFILQAAATMPDEHVHFCFVGDGNLRGLIESQIVQSGLSNRVHLTGLLPPERIPLVLHATDILVHCSQREGLARALPQAMLAGKPVVSFDIDGASEVVNADTGILLPSGDVDGLCEALRKLAGSAELRANLGQAGRQLATRRFDHNVMVDEIEAVYEKPGRRS